MNPLIGPLPTEDDQDSLGLYITLAVTALILILAVVGLFSLLRAAFGVL